MIKFTSDKIKVYKKAHDGKNGTWYTYSLSIASKDQDGNWLNSYADCLFKKGVEVDNKAIIAIDNAFPVLNKGKDDKVYMKWMITEFRVIEDGEKDAPADNSFMNIPIGSDEELPFV